MKKSPLAVIFLITMLICTLFLIAYVPLRAGLNYSLDDTALQLETSIGREKKQQAEYDEVIAAIPPVTEELAQKKPLADDVSAQSASLKEERKALRAEKAALEEQLNILLGTEKEAADE